MLNQITDFEKRNLESCELRERERKLGAFNPEMVAEAKGPEGMAKGGGHE